MSDNEGPHTYVIPAAVISSGTGSGGILANNFSGSDIGAKINAACASLPASGGTVYVSDGDYVQTTTVVIPSGVTVRLGRGTISNSITALHAHWQMKDHSRLIGTDWSSKIMAQVIAVNSSGCPIVTDYNSALDNSVAGNTDIVVRDVQFIRNPASTTNGIQIAAVQFGNIRDVLVDHCYFNGCEGYGVYQASSPQNGLYGNGFVIQNCLFENITTQHCGAINCTNWHIRNNLFRPTTATANYTVIDCEANGGADTQLRWSITGNTFDYNTAAIFNPGAFIQVVGGGGPPTNPEYTSNTGRARHGVISGNVCVSGSYGTNSAYFGQGLSLLDLDDVEIFGNVLAGCNTPIATSLCYSLHIHDNITGFGKQNDGAHIQLGNTFDCFVENNVCVEHFGAGWSTPNIVEISGSDYNIFKDNKVGFYPYVDPLTTGGRYAKIDLIGAHSRCFGNIMGPVPTPVDAPLITSVSELRNLDIPGSRPTAAPAVAMVGGYAAQADGGWSVWYYAPLSSATDNGITVVKPNNNSAQWNGVGRWLRAPDRIHITTTQRDALALTSADAGLTIWNTSTVQSETWNGTAWTSAGGGGGGTQGGATTATHVPYASSANTLSDGELTFTAATHTYGAGATTVFDLTASSGNFKAPLGSFYFGGQLAFGGANFWLDAAGLNLTGGSSYVHIGSSLAHAVNIDSTAMNPNGADKDLSLGRSGGRWNGLWNAGRLSANYNAQTGTTYTVAVEDHVVNMTNVAARAVTLYAANAVAAGTMVVIKEGAGTGAAANVTITRAGTDAIDGGTSVVINANWGKVTLVSDGVSSWSVIG